MSSISVAKYNVKGRNSVLFSFWLGRRTLRSSLRKREARSGMGFAFAARRSTSSLVRRRASESRSEAELPPVPKADMSTTFAKRTWQVCQRQTLDACPYKRYFTFFEKYVIITSTNNFQKLFWTFPFLSV